MKKLKAGEVRPGRIPVYSDGLVVGNVGPKCTAATARRFNAHNATLRKVDGRLAWVGFSKPQRRRPLESEAHKHARGSVRAPGR